MVFALRGDLGAGKTTFVQGFFKGLGFKKNAPSPTFVIVRRHALGARDRHKTPGRGGQRRSFQNAFHIDAYRLKKAADLEALDFKNIVSDPLNIVLIEWADRAKGILPKGTKWLHFAHGRREHERTIKGVL